MTSNDAVQAKSRTVVSLTGYRALYAAAIAALSTALLVSAASAQVAPQGPRTPVQTCASLAGLQLKDTKILGAKKVAATKTVPAYCNVVGVIDKRVSRQDPDHDTYGIVFEVNLPSKWVGRFELMGGGGTDGSVSSPMGSAGTELSQGWAVAADDGGHQDASATPPKGVTWNDDDAQAGGSAHFGIDEQAREDYGFNGVDQTTIIAKEIIARYYGKPAEFSYLWGCSNGGRDGMLASQRRPDYFNGIVAGNPGYNLPKAAVAEAWNEQKLAPLATATDKNGQPDVTTTFTNADLEVASAAIIGACDKLDGLVDGIIDNFSACTNDVVYPALKEFTCRVGGAHGNKPHGGSCLTSAQVGALKKIFAGPQNSKGTALYSSWYWDGGIWDPTAEGIALGWQAWNVAFLGAPGYNSAINLTLGAGAVPMIFTTPPVVTPVNGPTSQEGVIFKYNFDKDAPKIFAKTKKYPMSAMGFMAADSEDLGAFQKHGGKLIVYDSVNDGIFSGRSIVDWYNGLASTGAPKPRSYARLFMVPNMAHCGGGPATNSFSGTMLTAITDWVEKGVAPDRIIASNPDKTSPFPAKGKLFDPKVAKNFPTGGTRPLCPYPQQSRYKGSGATNDAANFRCVAPGE